MADEPLIYQIFSDSRSDIHNATHLSEELRANLIQNQYKAQQAHFEKHFPDADYAIIQSGNTPVGRIYLNKTNDETLILEFNILSKYRSQGLGSSVLKAVLEEARLASRPVRLHVEKGNPAAEFYFRHGFEIIGEKPTHFELKWSLKN